MYLKHYKIKFLTLYLLSSIVCFILFYIFLENSKKTDINKVSIENFKNKFSEKEEYLQNFFGKYTRALNSITEDRELISYINNNIDKEEHLENIFLVLKKSLGSISSIRYIDENGIELVKVDGTPVDVYKKDAISKVVLEERLQNKYSRYYFHRFMRLKKGEVGVSKIDLNREDGKIKLPKKVVIRLGKAIFDRENNKKGIIVINISLENFLNNLAKTTLYNIYIIDNFGKFIYHNDTDKGILSEKFYIYLLEDELGVRQSKSILEKDEFYGDGFYSHKIDGLNTGQNLKILLKPRFEKITKDADKKEKLYLLLFLLIFLALIPIIVTLSKLPDVLKKEVNKKIKELREKDKLINRQAKFAALGEMMDAIAHQWKQPLSVISMQASALNLKNSIDKKSLTKKYIDSTTLEIQEQVSHLVETVDDFRKFFRPNVKKEKISIKKIIKSVIKLEKSLLSQNDIETIIDIDDELEYELISTEFKHVVINLINNSKDAFNENKIKDRKIIFTSIKNEKYLILNITDNAGGIPKKVKNSLFNANVTTKVDGKGTGIGLYLSKQIIEKINGKLEVENVEFEDNSIIQKGARFSIYLPI